MPKPKSSEQLNIPPQLLAETFLDYAGALVLVLDKDGRIIQFNQACEKLSGLSFSEVKGKYPWDTVLPPEDAEAVRKNAFETLANNPQSMSGSYTNYWLTKQNEPALIDWINTVVLDESGHMKNIVSVGIDVTKTRHQESELKKSEVRLNDAQRIAKVGSWELDLLTNELFWTDEMYNMFEVDKSRFGASYEAFLNTIHPDDRDMVNKAYTDSLVSREPYEVRHRLKLRNGDIRYVNETCETSFDITGKPLRSVGTTQDITELNKIENELSKYRGHLENLVQERTADMEKARDEAERANAAKSDFLSSMSHELRTPLNAILGFAQLLELGEEDDSKKENIQEIIDGGNHLLELINQILDLAKIESGNIKLSIGNYSLHKIFNNSLSMVKPLADQHNIQINENISSLPDININVDEMRFKQVLLNILSNAIKYNSEKGTVTIDDSSTNENMFCLSITDTGKGFTEEQLAQIFKPFERFDAANSHIEGAGLGLVIAKDLIEKMKGAITVESQAGKGSCFMIHVPLS